MKKTTTYARKRRQADPMGGLRLIGELRPFDQAEQTALALPPRVAFEAMRDGKATDGDFDTLAAVVSVAMVRCEEIGREGVELCQEAQGCLMDAKVRHERTGRWGFDYRALQAIPAAIEIHEQLLALSTPRQMMDAMREVVKRMNAGQVHEVVHA